MYRPAALILIVRVTSIPAMLGALLLLSDAVGQAPPAAGMAVPRPNGAKADTTVEVILTGTDLDEPQDLLLQRGDHAECRRPSGDYLCVAS